MTAPTSTGAGYVPAQGRSGEEGAGLVRDVRVGRQGIYTADRTLAAYELLFHDRARRGGDDLAVAGEQATSQVIASTFGTFGLRNISDGRPVFINFTRAFLTGVIPLPVEPELVVIEVVENVIADRELLIGLRQLRDAGLPDRDRRPDRPRRSQPLLELADYVKIDVNGDPADDACPASSRRDRRGGRDRRGREGHRGRADDAALRRVGRRPLPGLLPAAADGARAADAVAVPVDLRAPAERPGRPGRADRVGSSRRWDAIPVSRCGVLRTANSASVSANREVTSLRQALAMIGPRRLRSWVVLTLLEGGTITSSSDDLWARARPGVACRSSVAAQADLAFTVGHAVGRGRPARVSPTTGGRRRGPGRRGPGRAAVRRRRRRASADRRPGPRAGRRRTRSPRQGCRPSTCRVPTWRPCRSR